MDENIGGLGWWPRRDHIVGDSLICKKKRMHRNIVCKVCTWLFSSWLWRKTPEWRIAYKYIKLTSAGATTTICDKTNTPYISDASFFSSDALFSRSFFHEHKCQRSVFARSVRVFSLHGADRRVYDTAPRIRYTVHNCDRRHCTKEEKGLRIIIFWKYLQIGSGSLSLNSRNRLH